MGGDMSTARRCILGVFAHPDDETTSSAGTLMRYARQGVEVHVVTATRGERGTLGTGGLAISREELPAVREAELRAVLEVIGARTPILLGYRDQELAQVDARLLANQVASVMGTVRPDVVITFGPTGISGHEDHIAIHEATVRAFRQYRAEAQAEPRLYVIALPRELVEELDMQLHQIETTPTVLIDISEYKARKIAALRMYRSQEDAQEVAGMFEANSFDAEAFHQLYPPVANGLVSTGFWDFSGGGPEVPGG
jgi:LmbE family N-acetylglucosaminyl deacetylase